MTTTTTRKTARATAPVVPLRPATRCRDYRCHEGVTACHGCRGHGRLRVNGSTFRYRTDPANITDRAPIHDACGGTGRAVCGCRKIPAATARKIGPVQERPHLDTLRATA